MTRLPTELEVQQDAIDINLYNNPYQDAFVTESVDESTPKSAVPKGLILHVFLFIDPDSRYRMYQRPRDFHLSFKNSTSCKDIQGA